jgi:phage I-like protein
MDLSLLVDISHMEFDEPTGGAPSSWVQAMHHAEYKHPLYGKIKFTPERTQRFAENVNVGVRGHELDIDYDHKATTGKAAGWVKEARADDTGLHVRVEWTPAAVASIRAGEYKYFSPEFTDEWEHPSTGKKFKDVLFGGGITNRPFLKGMSPLNLSEHATPGGEVDPMILRQTLGLSEDATDEQVLAKVAELASSGDNDKDPPPAATPPQADPQLQELSEKNPAVKALMDMVNLQSQQIASLSSATQSLAEQNKNQAVTIALAEIQTKGKFALPPAVADKLRPILVASDAKTTKALMEIVETLIQTGTVALGESGSVAPSGQRVGGNATELFEKKVQECMEQDKLEYADACARVAMSEPDLFEAYRDDATAFRIGTK